MSKDEIKVKIGKNGRPIITNAAPSAPQAGWKGGFGGGIGKNSAVPAFTKRRTGTRGDK